MSVTANSQGPFSTLSITTRLTVLYTLSTLAILLFAIVFQFFALVNDLEYEDNEFVSDKIRVIRAMIDRYPNDPHHLTQEVQWEGGEREHTRYMVRILDQGGREIMATAGMDQLAPVASFPQPALSGGRIGRGVKLHAPEEKVFLINAAWGASGSDHRFRHIQIALDVTDEEALLAAYRRKMTFVFFAGIFFSALLSVAVARSGLRPLSTIAASAGEVSIDTLSHRVGNRPWPRELMQVATAIDSMLSRLELSFVRLSEFSANLAHELRTPLNNLRGEAEVTLARPRTP
ncbi:MAG TPA: histidine kinase dimerization/phospho-acceptor domain-containing protein, partial [Geobacterales bacterium]|nr:histidine kinase dimerization/phospho-acceptor domain-containing protein [Geobacterales bacterium]